MQDVSEFYASNRQAWRIWLEQNHDRETAVWLVFDKGQARTMSWQDIVQEALCFGWIDSRPGKVSDSRSKIYMSKRRPNSVWSKINKQNVEQLTSAGLMAPAGLAAIEIAKQNGSWSTLDLSDKLVQPPELAKLFAANPGAKVEFSNFPIGSQRNTLQWIYNAKTTQTRLRRVQQVVDAAKLNKRLR